jgi:hypothetical protein
MSIETLGFAHSCVTASAFDDADPRKTAEETA